MSGQISTRPLPSGHITIPPTGGLPSGELLYWMPGNAPSGYHWMPGACGSIYMSPLPPSGVTVSPYGGYIPPSYPALSGATADAPVPEFPGHWHYPVYCGGIYCPLCFRCKKVLTTGPKVTVNHTGCMREYCLDCAGYAKPNGFETREDWIRETVPLQSGTPSQIVADWLLDQGREKDANYMRETALRMSGG